MENIKSVLRTIGCKNDREIDVAFNVYKDLISVRKLQDIKCYFNNELQKIYFSSVNPESELSNIYLPVSTDDDISFDLMQKLPSKLCPNTDDKKVILIFLQMDSTCIYYEISDGIGDPPGGKDYITREIRKKQKFL